MKSIIVSSDVLAAYASFLWDINDDESEDEMNMQSDKTKVFLPSFLLGDKYISVNSF